MTSFVRLDLLREAFQSVPEKQQHQQTVPAKRKNFLKENTGHGTTENEFMENATITAASTKLTAVVETKNIFPVSLSGFTAFEYLPTEEYLSTHSLKFMQIP